MKKLNVKSVEFLLLCLVGLISLAANLPEHILSQFIDQQTLLLVLAAVVVIALFRYLRLLLFLCVATLAVGANLPERLAEPLGISPTIMLVFLAGIVLVSLLNKVLNMPVELAPPAAPRADNEETRRAMLIAISIGNIKRLKWLIAHNMEFNFVDNGAAPVLLAAEKGNSEIMQLLIHHGADLTVKNNAGKTPLELAQAHGFNRTAELIKFALENREAAASQAVAPGVAQPGHPPAHSGQNAAQDGQGGTAKADDVKEPVSA